MRIFCYLVLAAFLAACSNPNSSSGGSGGNINKLEKITPELAQKFKDFSYANSMLAGFVASSISYGRFSANAPKDVTDNCSIQFTYGQAGGTASGISSSIINVNGDACPLDIKFERGTIPNSRSEIMKWDSTYIVKSNMYQVKFGISQVKDTYEVSYSTALEKSKIYSKSTTQEYLMTDGSLFEITKGIQTEVKGDTQIRRYIVKNTHNGNTLKYWYDLSLDKDGNEILSESKSGCMFNDKEELVLVCRESGLFDLKDIGGFTTSYHTDY